MEEKDFRERDRDSEEIFSKAVRAGKRTYFFDVKATIGEEYYLTITESKRRFNNDQGKFFYEKHKLFLYKEDFEKFAEGLAEAIQFIKTGQPEFHTEKRPALSNSPEREEKKPSHTDLSFEDLSGETDED